MKPTVNKKTILYLLLFLWIVFSAAYIVNDVWRDFQNVRLLQAYEQGKADTINAVIQEAEKCEPFSVFSEEKQIQLIEVGCLQSEEVGQ